MRIQVNGKHVDVGDALRAHVSDRLASAVAKYYDRPVDAHVTVARDASEFKVDCFVHLSTGMTLQGHARSAEPYPAVDQAVERLEKRLRRYKRRLKDHHNHRAEPISATAAASYVLAGDLDEADEEPEGLNPVVIAEDTTRVPSLTVGEAVMQLDFLEQPALLFRNTAHGGLNVVYRRSDGHVGWIDPQGSGAA
ncbi:MAG: ribosome-associated translation inhibitor RaiA [Alphaproteobacteria bacterium]|nr:ribosome-associated translation inhibitor RaiA [Alphaproteobacteria bacterium]